MAHSIGARHYIAIFSISLAAIAFQILLTRFFSVTLSYHFTFVGITFVMLGLTAGALDVFMKKTKYASEHAEKEIALNACCFALLICLGLIIFVCSPSIGKWLSLTVVEAVNIATAIAFLTFPLAYLFCGICIAIFLTRFPAYTGKLYAFDLCGAALGCIVVILGLLAIDPLSLTLLLSWILIFISWKFLPPAAPRKSRIFVCGCFSLISLLVALQGFTALTKERPLFHLEWTKRFLTENVEFERWNTYSYVSVKPYESKEPFGWGYGKPHDSEINQKMLNIDGDAGTVITAFDGNVDKVSYLKDDVTNLVYHVRPQNNVAIIGLGGGRDVLSGLVFGAKNITGIEINPAIFEALTSAFGDFSGHLDTYPGVKLVNAEARSYLNSQKDDFSLIQISLIDTWAATAEGGLTLTENKLYTTDAWVDFMDRLDEKGVLTVSRWFDKKNHVGEFYRLLSIAHDAHAKGHQKTDVSKHILAALSQNGSTSNVVTILFSKSPFTEQEIKDFYAACDTLGFMPAQSPQQNFDAISKAILDDGDTQLIDNLPININASTDDKPFFFNMLKFKNVFNKKDVQSSMAHLTYTNNYVILLLVLLVGLTFCLAILFIGIPLVQIWRQGTVKLSSNISNILYFSGIGAGFMLVEISHIQRLMIFLGHPVYGLSVALFTLLLFSGLGSYTVCAQPTRKAALARPLLLCIVLIATGLLTPLVTEQVKYFDVPVRIIASVLLLAPMGFFMGMMFPLGMALNKSTSEDVLPWFWGINGAASVFASTFSMVFSIQYGITATFWAGVFCYVICMLTVAWMTRRTV